MEAAGKVTEEEEVSEEKRKELMMVSAGRGCKEVLRLESGAEVARERL